MKLCVNITFNNSINKFRGDIKPDICTLTFKDDKRMNFKFNSIHINSCKENTKSANITLFTLDSENFSKVNDLAYELVNNAVESVNIGFILPKDIEIESFNKISFEFFDKNKDKRFHLVEINKNIINK